MIAEIIALCIFTTTITYLAYLICTPIWRRVYPENSFAREIHKMRKYLKTNEMGLCEAATCKHDNPLRLICYFKYKFREAFPGLYPSITTYWFETHDERLHFLDKVLEDIKKDRHKEYSIYMTCKL